MTPNSLDFNSQNLVVDYISFKFQKSQCDQNKIAEYFFNLGFNSYQESGKSSKPIRQPIFVNSKNQHEICFILDNVYWEGILLHFSGLNAARFYLLAKQNSIHWQIFDAAIFSRFDLYYERKYKTTDQVSGKEFLSVCQKELKPKNRNINLEKNNKG